MATNDPGSRFSTVLAAELDEIGRLRGARGDAAVAGTSGGDDVHRGDAKNPYRAAHQSQLIGLAFSGGGIRSATFNLGILQVLAERKLLGLFDYLSTVSGGGYIGGWLAAWIRRTSFAKVAKELPPNRADGAVADEAAPVRHLRDYSSYLTPRRGMFSGDTWTLLTTYARNLLLNQLVLLFAIAAVLVVPRIAVYVYHEFIAFFDKTTWTNMAYAVFFLLALAVSLVRRNLASLYGSTMRRHRTNLLDRPFWVIAMVVVPVVIASWLIAAWLWKRGAPVWATNAVEGKTWLLWALATAVVYTALWIVAWIASISASTTDAPASAIKQVTDWVKHAPGRLKVKPIPFGIVLFWAFFSGLLAGPLLLGVARLMHEFTGVGGTVHAATFGMPLVVVSFALVAVLHVGLSGSAFEEEAREWWSRVGAYLLVITSVLLGMSLIALYAPQLIDFLSQQGWWNSGLLTGWAATSLGGLWAGHQRGTGTAGRLLRSVLVAIAPYVFVLGLLVIVAWGLHKLLPDLLSVLPRPFGYTLDQITPYVERTYWVELVSGIGLGVAVVGGASLALSFMLSWRFGVNEFSLHAMYGNRLIRAYLGASNATRSAESFTGFDPNDNDVTLSELTGKSGQYAGPYVIVNAALNLVSGAKLAWQQRKATSFVFTPRYSGYFAEHDATPARGYSVAGYRPTNEYGGSVRLGKAMVISGAAASPAMGYHTTPALAFLMTVFNVRLGWWLGNPRHPRTWRSRRPAIGLWYLLCELLNLANDRRGYVYLSDGGHFENLGIYELVRRRCRVIVACDAAEDRDMKFGDLGNAVEKCRADLGVDVRIDFRALERQAPHGYSRLHYAVGEIDYRTADGPDVENGVLIYIKSSLTGEEPANVRAYAALKAEFPHESTADQWFDESQFEGYRALGMHVARSVFPAPPKGESGVDYLQTVAARWRAAASGKQQAAVKNPSSRPAKRGRKGR